MYKCLFTCNLLDNQQLSTFKYNAWGGTDWPQDIDHHLQVSINDQVVSDKFSNGVQLIQDSVSLNEGLLSNPLMVKFTLPGDSGVDYDLIQLDNF